MLRTAEIEWPHPPEVPLPKQPDAALTQAAADRLAHAARPAILAGGGALGAGGALVALAERLGAPVIMTTEGKGAVPASHPLTLPMLAVPALLGEIDVLLIVGSRAHLSRGPLPVPPTVEVIRVDIDPSELDQSVKPSIAIEADAGMAAVALLEAVEASSPPGADASSAGSCGPGSPPVSPISRRAASSCGPRSPRVGCSSTR
jgi:acetolactate synthase-1/2/3 large subunit